MTDTPVPGAGHVVIRPPNWLGDAVLALPAMTAVRAYFPDARLTVAAAPSVAGLFSEVTGVNPDDVIELPAGTRAAAAVLSKGRHDVGVLFPNSFRSAWQFRRGQVRASWGYPGAWRGWLLARRSPKPRRRGLHQADYYRELVRGLGIACGDDDPRLSLAPATRDRAQRALTEAGLEPASRFVALAPGAAYGQAKQWPPARVGELCARLVREEGVRCVLVGAPHDREASREIESWLRAHADAARPGVVDLVGRTNLRAFMGIADRAAVFVANDSGAMHVAAALGRPVVALFGSTDERATRPLGSHDVLFEPVFCRPCLLRDCPIDHRCMKRLSVSRVFEAVSRRLATPS